VASFAADVAARAQINNQTSVQQAQTALAANRTYLGIGLPSKRPSVRTGARVDPADGRHHPARAEPIRRDQLDESYPAWVLTITAVIPTYNRFDAVIKAIDSVKAQTYPVSEIIVVDDGSISECVKNTRAIDGITLIEQPNRGAAAARNAGARAGLGELIAFLDDDDRWRPEKLAVQLPMLDDLGVALVHHAAHLYDPRSGWETDGYSLDAPTFHDVLDFNPPAIQTTVVRRSVFEAVGGFDESLLAAEDWDFFLRVAADHRIVGTPQVLADLDAVPGLGGNLDAMFRGSLRLLEKARGVHPGCADCARIIHRVERVIRMHGVETEKARARRLRGRGHPLHAAAVRVAAYRYDPVAIARLPRRAWQWAVRGASGN
jgi:hypothetical protein